MFMFSIGFEIFIPENNERKFRLPRIIGEFISQFDSSQIFIDKTYNSYEILPMMFVNRKLSNKTTKSLILVEKSIHLSSIQTANVTIIFHHRVSEYYSSVLFQQ